VPIEGVGRAARDLLEELQRSLHAESLADREAHTYLVDDLEELRRRVGGGGFFRLAWCGSPDCEQALGEGTGATIRVILEGPAPDGSCLVDGAQAEHDVLVARAY
jgi:prolyl-tRNA synthetase